MTKEFFKVLFDAEDHFCYGSKYCRSVTDVHCDYTYRGLSYTQYGKDGKLLPSGRTEFFTINPLKKGTSRLDINVEKHRNFLFEMDDVDLKSQIKILDLANVPVSTLTFSGGKSIHAIISLEEPIEINDYESKGDTTKDKYLHIFNRITAYIVQEAKKLGYTGDIVDTSCQNPSRLSRFPTLMRYKDKREIEQQLLKVNHRISADYFMDFLSKCPKVKPIKKREIVINPDLNFDLDNFHMITSSSRMHSQWQKILEKLYEFKGQEPHGMYPYLKKYYIYAVQDLGCNRLFLEQIRDNIVIPKLLSFNYPLCKLEDGLIEWIDNNIIGESK